MYISKILHNIWRLWLGWRDLNSRLTESEEVWERENLAIFAPKKLSKNCRLGQENRQKPIKNHYFLRFFLLPKNRL